jgi:hypothetical protein
MSALRNNRSFVDVSFNGSIRPFADIAGGAEIMEAMRTVPAQIGPANFEHSLPAKAYSPDFFWINRSESSCSLPEAGR